MVQSYIFDVLIQTPLHWAAVNGKGDAVKILLRNGANINEKNVKNIFVGETDDFERKRKREQRKRERR
jgi:ankyrin repeat protein